MPIRKPAGILTDFGSPRRFSAFRGRKRYMLSVRIDAQRQDFRQRFEPAVERPGIDGAGENERAELRIGEHERPGRIPVDVGDDGIEWLVDEFEAMLAPARGAAGRNRADSEARGARIERDLLTGDGFERRVPAADEQSDDGE